MAILLLTQGNLARELLISARAIAGGLDDFEAVCLDWAAGLDEGRRQVRSVLETMGVQEDEGILILTDMFGGTPYNVAASFRRRGEIEVIAGVNLPMVVRLGCLRRMDLSLRETAEWLRDKGRNSICLADWEGDDRSSSLTETPCLE